MTYYGFFLAEFMLRAAIILHVVAMPVVIIAATLYIYRGK